MPVFRKKAKKKPLPKVSETNARAAHPAPHPKAKQIIADHEGVSIADLRTHIIELERDHANALEASKNALPTEKAKRKARVRQIEAEETLLLNLLRSRSHNRIPGSRDAKKAEINELLKDAQKRKQWYKENRKADQDVKKMDEWKQMKYHVQHAPISDGIAALSKLARARNQAKKKGNKTNAQKIQSLMDAVDVVLYQKGVPHKTITRAKTPKTN